MRLNVHTLFDNNNQPQLTVINNGKSTNTYILYHSKTGLSISDIERNKKVIKKLIEAALAQQCTVVLSDFKAHIDAFDIETTATSDIYDVVLPEVMHRCRATIDESSTLANTVIDHIISVKPKLWQKLFANAGIVYHDLQKQGIAINGKTYYPTWSQKVFSGRSKTSGFALQGKTEEFDIRPINYKSNDVYVHFDWKAADIRAAALLSGDERLLEISYHNDPYNTISEELGITERAIAKRKLLSAINSLNIDSDAVKLFPTLLNWIRESRRKLHDTGRLYSLLGRPFDIKLVSDKKDDPKKTVFNATMQGSIAHAMHNSIKRVWDLIGHRLICENHDSLTVTCRGEPKYLKPFIRDMVDIIKNPYRGLLSNDPTFPVAVSLGFKWRKWQKLRVFS